MAYWPNQEKKETKKKGIKRNWPTNTEEINAGLSHFTLIINTPREYCKQNQYSQLYNINKHTVMYVPKLCDTGGKLLVVVEVRNWNKILTLFGV